MSHYEYFPLFLALVFCGYAIYTDLKTQKIRNFCSFGLLYVGTLSHLIAWYLGTTTPVSLFALFFGSGIIAFALYWFGVFSPGDSKFFWGLCLILPVSLFSNLSGTLSFPPLILAVNIIVPYAIGILGYLLFKFAGMPNKLNRLGSFLTSSFREATRLEKLYSLLVFIGIGAAVSALLEHFGWHPDRFLQFVFVLAVFTFVQKRLSAVPKTWHSYGVTSVVCVGVAVQTAPSVSVFLSGITFFFGVYLVFFVIVKQCVLQLVSVTLDTAVDVHRLEVGMIPAEQIVRVERPDGTLVYEKRQVAFSSGTPRADILVSPDPAGLTTEEITTLRNLAAKGAFAEYGNQINVQPSIRCAPVISLGALVTVVCQGPFYLKLMQTF